MLFRPGFAFCIAIATGGLLAAEEQVVFRSDVSLVRVDAQVVTRANRTVTGLPPQPATSRPSQEPIVDTTHLGPQVDGPRPALDSGSGAILRRSGA